MKTLSWMVLLALGGCKGGDTEDTEQHVDTDTTDTDTTDTDTTPAPVSLVRLMNHVWDRYPGSQTTGLHIHVPPSNTVAVGDALPLGANSGYTNLFVPGDYTVGLWDETSVDQASEVTEFAITLVDQHAYTVEVYGFARPDLLGLPGALAATTLVIDDPMTASTSGATVRFMNTASGSTAISFWDGSTEAAHAVSYGTASAGVEMAYGTHVIGIDQNNDGTAELVCSLTFDASSFLADTPHLIHVSVQPDFTQGVGAILAYVTGAFGEAQTNSPIGGGTPCAPPS
jgi:hypothetical protein